MGVTGDYKRFHGHSRVFQMVPGGFRGILGVSWGFKSALGAFRKFWGVPGNSNKFQRPSSEFHGFKGVSCDLRSVPGIFKGF